MADIKVTASNVWVAIRGATSTAINPIKRLDVQHGKKIAITRVRQIVVAICIVSVLFCMWGLAYGMLDIMNYHVRIAMHLGRAGAALLAAAYYGGYIPGTVFIGGPIVRNAGYRLAFFVGLSVVGLGNLFMSLGAGRCSLAGMCLGHLVIGTGVSTLERSANAYAVNCGPRQQATLRILFAQAWAGVGTVIAPFLANAFVFNPDSSGIRPEADLRHPGKCIEPPQPEGSCNNLGSVITFYRALSGFVLGLAVVFAVILFRTTWVPEVEVPASPPTTCGWKRWKHPLVSLKYARVWWGVCAQFVNIGCQVTFAQFFIEHMKVNACASDAWAAYYFSIAQGVFVMGRFAAAGLIVMPTIFRPRYVLLFFMIGAVATTAAGTAVTGKTAIALAVMVMFFEAPSFPMIFESATAGFEEWTPTCETLMTLSISGGALQPALMGKLVEAVGISAGWSLTTGCFGLFLTYCLATNFIPSFRRAVDNAEVKDEDNVSRNLEMQPTTSKQEPVASFRSLPQPQPSPQTYFTGNRHNTWPTVNV